MKISNFSFLALFILIQLASAAENCQNARGLIYNGDDTNQCHWPFVCPLFYHKTQRPRRSEFFCASSLINKMFVITAAHCVWDKSSKPTKPNELYVYPGRNSLDLKVKEPQAVVHDVAEIFVHQDWNPSSPSYDGDIALVKMTNPVTFNDRTRPIALPTVDEQVSEVNGYIFGWGASEREEVTEKTPKIIKVRTNSAGLCRYLVKGIRNAISDRSFCVGGDGRLPCKGDSGGGFYRNVNGELQVLGIISAGGLQCTDEEYAIATDVTQFIGWIKSIIDQDTRNKNFSWIAQIYYQDGELLCSGSLVHPQFVLTAANCVQAKGFHQTLLTQYLKVKLGSAQSDVEDLKVHHMWNYRFIDYTGDLAMLKLRTPFAVNRIAPIRCDVDASNGVTGSVAFNYRDKTIPIPVKSLPYAQCVQADRQLTAFLDGSTMYCGHQTEFDFCSGGKGEPFITYANGQEVFSGIVSIGSANLNECQGNKTLMVTDVGKQMKWIKETACGERCPTGCQFYCYNDSECPNHLACRNYQCSDPCAGVACSDATTQCVAVNHRASCSCRGQFLFNNATQRCEETHHCGSNLYIPIGKRCDGFSDCPDRSDERGCQCSPRRHFQCDDGFCVALSKKCNRVPECHDGSDEIDCESFRCADGTIIWFSEKCNGVANCRDGSDESRCVRGYLESEVDFDTYPNVTVNAADFTIASPRNPRMSMFKMDSVKDAFHLPIKVAEKFPNIVNYKSTGGAVRNVARIHFYKLRSIELLILSSNKISNIEIDAFVDLVSLKHVGLGQNQIKSLQAVFPNSHKIMTFEFFSNGAQFIDENTFENKPHLNDVVLFFNQCLSKNYKKIARGIDVEVGQFDSISNLKKDLRAMCYRGNRNTNAALTQFPYGNLNLPRGFPFDSLNLPQTIQDAESLRTRGNNFNFNNLFRGFG